MPTIDPMEARQGKARKKMIDAEVSRLRRLRRVALLTRKLAQTLHLKFPDDGVFARSAVAAWSVARLLNGRLKSHPNLSYQQGPGALQTVMDHSLAMLTGMVAVKQGRPHSVFVQQLQILARDIQDTRALTWSAELGDAFGRAQWQRLSLLQDLSVDLRREGGVQAEVRAEAPSSSAAASSTDWPYLAI
jgi:hypothetical protein